MDRVEFKNHFARLVALYGNQGKDHAAVFYESVKDISASDFSTVVDTVIKTFQPGFGRMFPTPADIWKTQSELSRSFAQLPDQCPNTPGEESYVSLARKWDALPPAEKLKLEPLVEQKARELLPSWLRGGFTPGKVETPTPLQAAALRNARVLVVADHLGLPRPDCFPPRERETP